MSRSIENEKKEEEEEVNNSRPKRGAPLSQPFTSLGANWDRIGFCLDRQFPIDIQSCNQYLPQTNYKHFNRGQKVACETKTARDENQNNNQRDREKDRGNRKGIGSETISSKIIIFELISLRLVSVLFYSVLDLTPFA